MKFDYEKHWKEDELAIKYEEIKPVSQWNDCDLELPYKTRRCAKKYAMRDQSVSINPINFVEDPKYKGINLWDLNYISTSD